jgi:hypothetical protein
MNSKLNMTVILAVALPAIVTMGDIVWPADEDWTALTQGSDLYHDVSGEINPAAVDLVGSASSYSAGLWALVEEGDTTGGITNDLFVLRMRLRGNGAGKKFVWQAHLDTDGNSSDVEWVLQLVQSGSNNGVELRQTAIGGPTLKDVSAAPNSSWLGDLNLYSRWTAIEGSTDFHVDFAIPWSEFATITGATNITQLRAVLSTSTTHANVINGDSPLGGTLDEQVSNVLSDTIPEPAVATLLLSAGGGILAFRRLFKRTSAADTNDSRSNLPS